MSRRIDRPITVTLVNDPDWGMRPGQFVDQGVLRRVVQVTDRWTEVGEWWERPEVLLYNTIMWRVLDQRHGFWELEQRGQDWRVVRVED